MTPQWHHNDTTMTSTVASMTSTVASMTSTVALLRPYWGPTEALLRYHSACPVPLGMSECQNVMIFRNFPKMSWFSGISRKCRKCRKCLKNTVKQGNAVPGPVPRWPTADRPTPPLPIHRVPHHTPGTTMYDEGCGTAGLAGSPGFFRLQWVP